VERVLVSGREGGRHKKAERGRREKIDVTVGVVATRGHGFLFSATFHQLRCLLERWIEVEKFF
jgi:hypothetical protein